MPPNTPLPQDNTSGFAPDTSPNSQSGKPLSREESAEALKQMIHDSEEVMAQASTVFPLTMFPDTLSIDRSKVTIIKRAFFRVAEVTSIRIEDILSATSTVGPFFGGVRIIVRVFNEEQEVHIGPFWREDAERMKRIIHSYMTAKQRGVDTSQLGTQELATMLDELGQDNRS